jgi:hypothetical protein
MIMNERTTQLKEKAISELKKFAVIVAYLWVLFFLLQLHRLMILREQDPATALGYQFGFALVNALVLGKIMLIAEAFHLGDRFKDQALVWAILFKSALFSILLMCFDTLEKVLVGVFHHKSIAQSRPAPGGGGMERLLLVGIMVFIVLVPFFTIMETARVIGEDEVLSTIFKRRAS